MQEKQTNRKDWMKIYTFSEYVKKCHFYNVSRNSISKLFKMETTESGQSKQWYLCYVSVKQT